MIGNIFNQGREGLFRIKQQILRRANGAVYVTVGSKGCYWLENDQLKHQAGKVVDVVDTTGAGDVFHGAFAVAVAEKMETRQAVIFSNTVDAEITK